MKDRPGQGHPKTTNETCRTLRRMGDGNGIRIRIRPLGLPKK